MADLRGDVHDRGVLGAIRDRQRGERRLEHRQRRAGREQHGDVVGAARAQPPVAVADRPSLAERRRHRVGDVGRLALAQHLRRHVAAGVVVGVDPEHRHRAVVPPALPAGVERDEGRLHVGLGRDHLGEHAVDPVDDGRARPEVGREHDPLGPQDVTRPQVGRDVGSPEAVDRLLRVADDEEPARAAAGVGGRCVGLVVGRSRRAGSRGRAGSGRCPGTRRAAPAGSGGAGSGGRRR